VTSTSTRSRSSFLQQTILEHINSRVVCLFARLGVADALRDGPLPAAEIARTAGCLEAPAGRLLRAAVTARLVTRDSRGWYALTEIGHALRSDVEDSMRSLVLARMDAAGWGHDAAVMCGVAPQAGAAPRPIVVSPLVVSMDALAGDYVRRGFPGDRYTLRYATRDLDDAALNRLLLDLPREPILIVDLFLPEHNLATVAALEDVDAMLTTGGRIRTVAEITVCLEQAGFELEQVIDTPAQVQLLLASPAQGRALYSSQESA